MESGMYIQIMQRYLRNLGFFNVTSSESDIFEKFGII